MPVSHPLFHLISFAKLSEVNFVIESYLHWLLVSAFLDVDQVVYERVLVQGSQPVIILRWHVDDKLIAALGIGDVSDFLHRDFAFNLGACEKTNHNVFQFFVPKVNQPEVCQGELPALGSLSFVDLCDESGSQYLL